MMPPSFCGYEKMAVSNQQENVKIGVENGKVLHMQDNEDFKGFYYVECILVTIFRSQVKSSYF